MRQILSERFRTFAELECKGSSPLYYALSHAIAEDEAGLDIAGQAQPGQPLPNLLFAAVHYLLASDKYRSHPLAAFYPTCSPAPANSATANSVVAELAAAYSYFRDFILDHASEVIALLKSRRVQTNEVRRCAYLLPAFLFALSHFEPRPLALVEIGTSAGLNLLWDKYAYAYGNSAVYGDTASTVVITSSFRGVMPAALSRPLPEISQRIGLDLNIVDTKIPDQAAWLRALVWPEHHERRTLMDAALQMRNKAELDLRMGDGFAMLVDLAEEIPEDLLLCVYHTHVANQISNDAKQAFLKSIAALGTRREIIHIFNNIKPTLHLTAYSSYADNKDGQGRLIDLSLANTDGHARWIEWLQIK